MADASRLVEVIKQAARDEREASKPVHVYFGEVLSGSPLQINVEQKMVLGAEQLILTRNVTDFTVPVSVDWETEPKEGGTGEAAYAKHEHRIFGQKPVLVHNALKSGEAVILVRQQEGQKFIVMDRIGGKG